MAKRQESRKGTPIQKPSSIADIAKSKSNKLKARNLLQLRIGLVA
jgi:hypothetical protein